MADFSFRPSAANRPHEPYDGRDYGIRLSEVLSIELTPIPRARAPSYTAPNGLSDGNSTGVEGDRESLIKHHKGKLAPYEESIQPISSVPTTRSPRERRRKLQGWRFGVTCSAWIAFAVLVMNFILTIVAVAKFGSSDGVGTAFEGSCAVVNSWATWLHILINALSSILLSASNYTMQCLCSPTREEIDNAHAKGDWLDIGVASARNIFRIRWRRRYL
ncbi:hypothetical protein LTR62_004262 [Meristemomyces frigidus]|uniref:DUF6536 domain-containing protein n=1 Tax=Meristemomyces frigidus TaxID=1508187 RepID=A0AAN7TI42_9PEZI|nr:hypothetical protein LTR62_004262 [Meristemomyces frigidus]